MTLNLYKLPYDLNFGLILENAINVVKCPNCKRLFFYNYDEHELTEYVLEKTSVLHPYPRD